MAGYDGSIRINTQIDTGGARESLESLARAIRGTAGEITSLRSKMDALKGQKFETDGYKKLKDDLSAAEKELSGLIEKQNEWERLGVTSGGAWGALNEQIAAASDAVDSIKGKIQQLTDSGRAFTLGENTQEYANLEHRLRQEEEALAGYREQYRSLLGMSEQFSRMRGMARRALSAIGDGFSRTGRIAGKAFSGIAGMAKKAFSAIAGGSRQGGISLSGLVRAMLKYLSVLALANRMAAATREGFKNLAQASAPVNASLSALQSSLAQLKNSLATAFAPILTAVTPMLASLINMLSRAATYVGMFTAALTGAKSFTRAIAVQQDYAKSLDKTAGAAKKALGVLAGFDRLNVLNQNKDDGGGGGGGISPSDMFEEVPIDDRFRDMADRLKEMWDNSNFTGLGKRIGEWLKNALDSIPWHDIREKARKLGESLATLINGFVEVPGLGYSIGRTLAEALNTAFEFLNGFVHKLHWESVGKFIAETLNGFFESIDWKLIKDTFVTGFRGLAKSINSFIKNFHWDNLSTSLSNLANILSKTIYTFFSTVKWAELGKNLGAQLTKTVKGIGWKGVGEALGSVVQSALDFLISFVREMDMMAAAQAIIDTLKGCFEVVDIGDLAMAILAAIGTVLAVQAAGFVFTTAAGAIVESLAASIAASGLATVATTIVAGIEGAIAAIAPPLAIGAAAIAGIGTAVAAMEQDIKRETELEVFGGSLRGITDEIHDQTQAIKDRAQASMDYVQNAGVAETSMAQDLADRYFDLAEKERLTNAETEEMKRLAGLLAEKIPELNDLYDEQTGLLDANRQKVDELIQSRLKEIQLNAIEQALTKQYEEQANALLEMQKAIEPANAAQKHMNELEEEYKALSDKQSLLLQYDSLSEKINSCGGDTGELLAKQQELWNEITDGGKEQFPAYDSLLGKMGEVQTEIGRFESSYNEALKALSEPKQAYDSIGKNITDLTSMLTAGMTDAAGSAAEGYSKAMKADTGMKDSTLQQARDILKAARSTEGFDINSPSKKFEEIGKSAVEGFNLGITENAESSATAVSGWAAQILAAMKAALGIGEDATGDTAVSMFGGMITSFETTWQSFAGLWAGYLEGWKLSNEELYFGYDTWLGQWNNMILAYTDMNTQFLADWQANMKLWWDTMVTPYFTAGQWTEFGTNMKDGIVAGFKAVVAQIGGIMNSLVDMSNQALANIASAVNAMVGEVNSVSGGLGVPALPRISAHTASRIHIPALADGAVIRGGNPFMAVLGDQPAGVTNIETPLPTMVRAFEQAIKKTGGMSGDVSVRVYLGEKDITKAVKTEADIYFARTGRGLFEY